ncbi:MAG: hypothetical protein GKR93_18985 [Gammaproteobacteria bacterium]|nr:hypothetical protein [Gammaproteobacteria bacterium]
MKTRRNKRNFQLPLAIASLSFLAPMQSGLVNAANDDAEFKKIKNTQTLEEVVVSAKREKKVFERDYKSIAGKRIFDGPYGNEKFIIAIGQELKNRGEKKRVFTRGLKMPQSYASSSLDRYHYPVTDACGIEKFTFYEGGDFRALGHRQSEKEVLIDVMTGGGPFSAPGVWGPYDQVRGKRHKMKMIMGDAKSDGMGLMESGYAIGMKAKLPTYVMQSYGDKFNIAIDKAGQCLVDKTDEEAANRLISGKSN